MIMLIRIISVLITYIIPYFDKKCNTKIIFQLIVIYKQRHLTSTTNKKDNEQLTQIPLLSFHIPAIVRNVSFQKLDFCWTKTHIKVKSHLRMTSQMDL